MFKALNAIKVEPIGGKVETLYLLMIAAGLISAFPPMSQWVDDANLSIKAITDGVEAIFPAVAKWSIVPEWISKQKFQIGVPARLGLLAAGAFATYKIAYTALRKDRGKFVLHSSCNVESSDPPEYPPNTPGLLFGYTTDTGSPLFISDEDLCRHGIIVGQTGMGKSVFGKSLMYQQIQRGGGLLFVDGKLDGDNIQDIYEYAVFCGRGDDFQVVNPGRPTRSNTYNPILYGDPDEVAARIISLIPSTTSSAGADHYKQSANLALVCFISALQEDSEEQAKAWEAEKKKKGLPHDYIDNLRIKGRAYNFLDLALLTMNEGLLNNLMKSIAFSAPNSLTRKNLTIFLEQYARENVIDAQAGDTQIDLKRLKDTLGGIGARMHQFGSGNFGPVLNSYSPEVKLYEAIRDNKIVYVALPTMGKDVAAQNLGKMVVADLRTAISWLQMNKQDRPKIPFLAFMDEMSSYSTETLAVMFEQARSARVALLPAIQTDSGLSNISEDFKERVMANTEIKVFFKLSSQATAEAASDLIGETKRVKTSTSDSTGISASAQALDIGPNKSMSDSASSGSGESEQEEPLVHPNHIKSLEIGECIVLRSPRVWNIRIPSYELSQATKAAIGPLRINHGKGYLPAKHKFDAMEHIDELILAAQKSRIKPKKDKKPDGGPQHGASRQDAVAGGVSIESLVAKQSGKSREKPKEAEQAEFPAMDDEQ